MQFLYEIDPNLHDRCIRTDTHWEIILGRGIHIYKDLNPDKENRNYFQMGTYDLALRPCLQCKITYRRTE
jgi:ATP-dependent Lon protease